MLTTHRRIYHLMVCSLPLGTPEKRSMTAWLSVTVPSGKH